MIQEVVEVYDVLHRKSSKMAGALLSELRFDEALLSHVTFE